jgi:hypothetical protein
MQHRCIHCGQPSEVDDPDAQGFTCPACGKNSWISENTGLTETQGPKRFRFRDLAIGAAAALALCALVFLFFRREQPLHRLVFGDLRAPANENVTNSPPLVSSTASGGGSATPGPSAANSGQLGAGDTSSVQGNIGPSQDVVSDPVTGGSVSAGSVGPEGNSASSATGISGGAPAIAPQTASQRGLRPATAPAVPSQSGSQNAAGRPAATSSTRQSTAATSADGALTATQPDHVATEGTDELLQLKKDETRQRKATDPTSESAAAQLVALATDSKAGQGDSTNSLSGNSATATGGGLAGKWPQEERQKPRHPFDPEGGSNVIFVLDHSLSMKGEKSNAARKELVRTLEKLGPDKSFYVIFFPEKTMPAAGPLPATTENIEAMTNWIYSVGHSFGSDPARAMLKALDFRPDIIWLLSDGRFSEDAASTIRLANENIHARINTVGFYSPDGERVLKQIAEENHGSYRFVPPPSRKPAGELAPVGDAQPAQQ